VLCVESNLVSSHPCPDCLGWYEYRNLPAAEISMNWLCTGVSLNPVSQATAGAERSSFLHRAVFVQPRYFRSGKAKPQRIALYS